MLDVIRWLKKLYTALSQISDLIYAHKGRHRPGGADPLFPADYNIEPASDNAYDLGSSSYRWRNAYLSGTLSVAGAINTGSLQVGGVEVVDSARNLKNVSADAGIITSGRLPVSRLPDCASGYVLVGQGLGYDLAWRDISGIAGTITDWQHGVKTSIPFAHHGDWGHYGKIPTSAPPGGAERAYVDSANLYVHDGTSWVLRATKDWNNLINKPSTFPPSAHASSHKPGGSDPLFPANYSLLPSLDNTYDLGSSTYRWRNLYLAGSLTVPTANVSSLQVGGTTVIDSSRNLLNVVTETLTGLTADPTLAVGKIWFRSDLKQLRWSPDGTVVKQVYPADWGDITNKPSTFPPSPHADSHASGGSDSLGGKWIDPGYIGPRSNTTSVIYFRTKNIAGTGALDHEFSPTDDNYGSVGSRSKRWRTLIAFAIAMWETRVAAAETWHFYPFTFGHAYIVPGMDGYSYVGTPDYRFYLVRAVTITSGDLGFEEMRCMVCGKPFKENDSIVLKVRRVDVENRQVLVVPVHSECNPHPLSSEMIKHHEEEVLRSRGSILDRLFEVHNPEVSFEIVWEQPLNDELMYVQARFEDGVNVCPLVRIDAGEEEVVSAIREAYLREKRRLIEEHENRRRGEEKLKKLGKSWRRYKGKIVIREGELTQR